MPHRPIIVYDGACPICSREIAHYQRLHGAEQLHWVDASSQLTELMHLGLDREHALSIFHVRDAKGEWQTGIDAFMVLWARLPGYRWLAWTISNLRLQAIFRLAYRGFLRWRNRGRCDASRCR